MRNFWLHGNYWFRNCKYHVRTGLGEVAQGDNGGLALHFGDFISLFQYSTGCPIRLGQLQMWQIWCNSLAEWRNIQNKVQKKKCQTTIVTLYIWKIAELQLLVLTDMYILADTALGHCNCYFTPSPNPVCNIQEQSQQKFATNIKNNHVQEIEKADVGSARIFGI